MAGVLVFARPEYRPRYESTMIDFSPRRHYAPGAVRRAFAANGMQLRIASRFNGIVTLSDDPRPLEADALQVIVAPRAAKASWGPRLQPFDERFGNVLVTYGGGDDVVLARVRAAVSVLR